MIKIYNRECVLCGKTLPIPLLVEVLEYNKEKIYTFQGRLFMCELCARKRGWVE